MKRNLRHQVRRIGAWALALAGAGFLNLHGCTIVGIPNSNGNDANVNDNNNANDNGTNGGENVPLKEAKLIIEHNATDEDTGFQGAIDGEGWDRLDITGPAGVVLTIQGRGSLATHGLTELFFETVEPENTEAPIEDVLAVLPEWQYTIEGSTVDGNRTTGVAVLNQRIPAGPVLLTPAEGAIVPAANLVMSWSPMTQILTGEPVIILRYQLIVEKDEEPHSRAIGKIGMSLFVPASVTRVTVPNEFLEPGTAYKWEGLAVEDGGNQTLSSSEFATE
ncbi:MAG: hypothetical protein FLDDKLPJ_01992 [Phycisphaerae bacterium]|nr:hypothetical protein [Phycisphaerae bacterium]